MFSKTKLFLTIGLSLLLLLIAFSGYRINALSRQQVQIMEDYSTVNSIAFGILSINKWEEKITTIVEKQIQQFSFTPEQRVELQKEVEKMLHAMIDKAMSNLTKKQTSIKGKIRKAAVNVFVDEDQLHDQVPGFAKTIVDQVNKPSTKKTLKNLAEDKLDEVKETTFDSSMVAQRKVTNAIFSKYGARNSTGFKKKTDKLFADIRYESYAYTLVVFACILLLLALWKYFIDHQELQKSLFIFSLLAAGIVLIVGVSSVMIEVEARLEKIDFHLMGEHLIFEDQVLFFQSKSIIDVVVILLKNAKIDSIVVGLLILTFSVFFPLGKLISSGLYLLRESSRKNKFVHFFAFKSGKWSMADVMVVAIMLTYIGMNSMLTSQLAVLNIREDNITSIATNNTSLQPGYMVFVLFVVFALILSEILHRITKKISEISS
ncbi:MULTISPECIES: paraquat-inducible protein A [Olivibacter]|uniref:Paraquat-inducible protein A n=1 Tax=Olivibacter jilunii TaxID=985016 RepID=A0ABW6B1G7_9SPHI